MLSSCGIDHCEQYGGDRCTRSLNLMKVEEARVFDSRGKVEMEESQSMTDQIMIKGEFNIDEPCS